MRTTVHVDERKWPDRPHWQFDAQRLGDDRHGTWLYVPRSTLARRGLAPARPLQSGFVMCVPADAWWMVEFYWNHPSIEVYVNIGTRPRWDGGRVAQIDLDLDVVRRIDGAVEILDEDEFQEHRRQLGYPADVIERAGAAAERAVAMLGRRQEPFGAAARRWIGVAAPADEQASG